MFITTRPQRRSHSSDRTLSRSTRVRRGAPVAGAKFPVPVAGGKFPVPVAGGRFPAPVAGSRVPAPVAGSRFPIAA
jgi:hypothetical protein